MAANAYTCTWCRNTVPAGPNTQDAHKAGACIGRTISPAQVAQAIPAPAKPQKAVPPNPVAQVTYVRNEDGSFSPVNTPQAPAPVANTVTCPGCSTLWAGGPKGGKTCPACSTVFQQKRERYAAAEAAAKAAGFANLAEGWFAMAATAPTTAPEAPRAKRT